MYNPYRTRGRSFAAGIAALAVTAALASSLVESFDPAQLQRLEENSAAEQVAAFDVRRKVQPNKAIRGKAIHSKAIRRHA